MRSNSVRPVIHVANVARDTCSTGNIWCESCDGELAWLPRVAGRYWFPTHFARPPTVFRKCRAAGPKWRRLKVGCATRSRAARLPTFPMPFATDVTITPSVEVSR